MALVKCRECGKEISTTAATCPHCGVANPAGTRVVDPDTPPAVVESRPAVVETRREVVEDRPVVVKRGGGFARFLLWIVLIMFLAALAAWYFGILNFS
jgi:hypothetical protein